MSVPMEKKMKLHDVAGLFLALGILPMTANATESPSYKAPQKDFQWSCESPEASAEQKKTVRAIYDRVPSIEAEATCAQAMVVLEAIYSLELEGKDLTDLSPLAGLKSQNCSRRYL